MTGFYGPKGFFWDAPENVTIYIDNVRVGSAAADFSMMAPDASVVEAAPPKAPTLDMSD
jgi:hypothetical protein